MAISRLRQRIRSRTRQRGEAQLEASFARRGPWVTKFTVDGRAFGGDFDAMHDARIEQFTRAFPSARSVLELGSLEGGHTIALARQPSVSHVLGLEGRRDNLRRAKFVKRVLGVHNVEFKHVNLEEPHALEGFGTHDAVFCCGLLYHLPRPWELLAQITTVTDNLFLSTHVCMPENASTAREGYEGTWYDEHGIDDPLSGLSNRSFWPTLESLEAMVRDAGFAQVETMRIDEHHPNGPIVELSATTTPG